MRRSGWRAGALAGLLAVGAVSVSAGAWAQSPPNAAEGSGAPAGARGEAPGSAPLAGSDRSGAPAAPAEVSPAEQRSMAFTASGGECRETVPGGPMLALAYAIVLVVMGAYVALLARKNAKLAASLEELEAEIARRRGGAGSGSEG